jgi:hypothetical protein
MRFDAAPACRRRSIGSNPKKPTDHGVNKGVSHRLAIAAISAVKASAIACSFGGLERLQHLRAKDQEPVFVQRGFELLIKLH